MGLEAVVYVHRDKLPPTVMDELPCIDEQTGEVYFEDPEIAKKHPKNTFTAIRKSLGNVAMIGALRGEISRAADNNSILLSKVLYSGSHSGDIIGVSDLDKLESEIKNVRNNTSKERSSVLERFLKDLTELIMAARAQQLPIVFV